MVYMLPNYACIGQAILEGLTYLQLDSDTFCVIVTHPLSKKYKYTLFGNYTSFDILMDIKI